MQDHLEIFSAAAKLCVWECKTLCHPITDTWMVKI